MMRDECWSLLNLVNFGLLMIIVKLCRYKGIDLY